MQAVLAFDQGTTSSRAIVFDHSGSILGLAQREFTQHYPRAGWVEHDADEIWRTQLEVGREALAACGLSASDIAAIGVANQRETTVVWDRSTGQPLHRAIVWQDRRTASYCDSLKDAGRAEQVQRKTGLLIDSYFCASKIRWLLDHIPDAQARAERGELAFGAIDSWLLWKLTAGRVHAIDVSNASRSMLLDLRTCDWDDELLALFGIPRAILPEPLPSSHIYGETTPELFGEPIPLGGAGGDQQAALFGQNCTRPGMVKNTYGTGCFLLMNVGDQPPLSQNQLLTTVACSVGSQRQYALEGSVFVAGAAIQWLRDGLQILESSAESETLAASVPDSDGVYMVPAFAGLGAPHWDPYARGTIVGLTRGTTRAHLVRAALESIAFQTADVLEAMREDAGAPIEELRVDGGAAANNLLMQFQADIAQVPVIRPEVIETTAMGAAFLAGLAVGFWKDIDEIQSIWKTERVFQPSMPGDEAKHRLARWAEARRRSQKWESS